MDLSNSILNLPIYYLKFISYEILSLFIYIKSAKRVRARGVRLNAQIREGGGGRVLMETIYFTLSSEIRV